MKKLSTKIMASVLLIVMMMSMIPAIALTSSAAVEVNLTGLYYYDTSKVSTTITANGTPCSIISSYNGATKVPKGSNVIVRYEIIDSSANLFGDGYTFTSVKFEANYGIDVRSTYASAFPKLYDCWTIEVDTSSASIAANAVGYFFDGNDAICLKSNGNYATVTNGKFNESIGISAASGNYMLRFEIHSPDLNMNGTYSETINHVSTFYCARYEEYKNNVNWFYDNETITKIKLWVTRKSTSNYSITDITPAADDHGTVSMPATSQSGNLITVNVTPDWGYAFDKLEVAGAAVNGNTFVMPNNNVSVKVVYKRVYADILSYNDIYSGTHCTSLIPSSALWGSKLVFPRSADTIIPSGALGSDYIVISYTPEEDYKFFAVALGGSYHVETSSAINAVIVDVAQYNNMELGVVCRRYIFPVVDKTTDAHGHISVPEKAEEGKWVTIDVYPDEDYRVDSIIVDGMPITPSNGIYEFKMPDYFNDSDKATVFATFTKKEEVIFAEYQEEAVKFILDYFTWKDADEIKTTAINDILALTYDPALTLDANLDKVDDIINKMFLDFYAWEQAHFSDWEKFVAWLQDTYQLISNSTFVDENGIHIQKFLNSFFSVTLAEGVQLAKNAFEEACDNVPYAINSITENYLNYAEQYGANAQVLVDHIASHITEKGEYVGTKAAGQFQLVYTVASNFGEMSVGEIVENVTLFGARVIGQVEFVKDNLDKFTDAYNKYTASFAQFISVDIPAITDDHIDILFGKLEGDFANFVASKAAYVGQYLAVIPVATQKALNQMAKLLGVEGYTDIVSSVETFIATVEYIRNYSYEENIAIVMEFIDEAIAKVNALVLQYRTRYFDGYTARKIASLERDQYKLIMAGDEYTANEISLVIIAIEAYEFDVTKSVEENRAVIDGYIAAISVY